MIKHIYTIMPLCLKLVTLLGILCIIGVVSKPPPDAKIALKATEMTEMIILCKEKGGVPIFYENYHVGKPLQMQDCALPAKDI